MHIACQAVHVSQNLKPNYRGERSIKTVWNLLADFRQGNQDGNHFSSCLMDHNREDLLSGIVGNIIVLYITVSECFCLFEV